MNCAVKFISKVLLPARFIRYLFPSTVPFVFAHFSFSVRSLALFNAGMLDYRGLKRWIGTGDSGNVDGRGERAESDDRGSKREIKRDRERKKKTYRAAREKREESFWRKEPESF